MKTNRLDRFRNFIETHRSSHHPLFDFLEQTALENEITVELYSAFAVNIATRTMLSLSEIHACCIQASLDLNPLRTAYGVMTGAEEGGFGKPGEVHSILMMNALNYHGKVAFGMKPINLRYQMALIRLLYISGKYKTILELEKTYPGISISLGEKGIYDISQFNPTLSNLSSYAGIPLPTNFEKSIDIADLRDFERNILSALHVSGVLNATINYCLQQLDVLNNSLEGYVQGVGYAHECLADGMIYKMFRILYAQIDRYTNEGEFLKMVYPYFAAHGNYMDVYKGFCNETEGVEATHALRELEKLSELDDQALGFAWQGANDFANRNVQIWDELYQLINLKVAHPA
jgi:hypothetical protein